MIWLAAATKTRTAIKQAAHYIGVGISNLIQGLSPEAMVVAGTIVRAWSLIAGDIAAAAKGAICQSYSVSNVMPSTLGTYPNLMGAFSLSLTDKFASISIN